MEKDVSVNLLLVDDKPANLMVLEAVLDSLNCNIIKANSGQQALAVLETTDVALILLDVQMPVLDGFETAKLIKEKFPEKKIPIIFISAVYTDDPFILKGYRVGGIDYIPKPFEPSVLKAKVRVYTEGYKTSKILQLVEKQLGETASRYKLMLDDVFNLVCTTSLDGTMTFLNKAFESYTGFRPEEWVGKKFYTLPHPDDLEKIGKIFEETIKDHDFHDLETRILTQSGKYLPIKARVKPIFQNSGVEGVVCVVHDFSKKSF